MTLTDGRVRQAIAWSLAASLLALFIALPLVTTFSFDSWSFYELSRTIGRDFFRANTSREYMSGSAYSSAFPPLWPLVIALFSLAVGNIYSSYLAAFAAYAAFAHAAERLGRRVFGQAGIGLLSVLLMLRFLGVRSELGGGRSIPLYLCALAWVCTLLGDAESSSRKRAFALGLAAGAMTMIRFDALPATLLVLAGAWFTRMRRDRILMVAAGIAVALSPWVAYSLLHFQTAFATDNRIVALALDPRVFVVDFHVTPPRSMHDDPAAWAFKVVKNVPLVLRAFFHAGMQLVFVPALLLAAAIVAFRVRPPHSRALSERDRTLVVIALVALAPIAGNLFTGYTEYRYFAGPVWMLIVLLLGYLARARSEWFRYIAFALAVAAAVVNVSVLRYTRGASPIAAVRSVLDQGSIDTLVGCLRASGADSTNAVVFRHANPLDPMKFGAVTGWRTLPLPSNWPWLKPDERIAFLRSYDARYVAGPVPVTETYLGTADAALPCAVPLRRVPSLTS